MIKRHNKRKSRQYKETGKKCVTWILDPREQRMHKRRCSLIEDKDSVLRLENKGVLLDSEINETKQG